ncbi:hypothetical protein ACER0C_008315 [Sarotherodon galilaeus]
MWRVKITVVPVVIGALGAVTPKLGEWLQQIPGTTSEISVQKSAVLGRAKTNHCKELHVEKTEEPPLRTKTLKR